MKNQDELLEKYDSLIKYLARRVFVKNYEFDDIVQELRMGLLYVASKHDANKGASLETMFTTWVRKLWMRNKLEYENAQIRGSPTISLDCENEDGRTLLDTIESHYVTPDKLYENEIKEEFILQFLASLPTGHYALRYFIDDKTLADIAKENNVSLQYVHKMIKQSIEKLKEVL